MAGAAPILGVLGGLAGIANTVPYVRDTLRGTTRPHRGSWLIWTVLAIVVYAAQHADGASWSLVTIGTQAAITGFVFLLAIRHGEGGVAATDLALLLTASAGVTGWLIAREPVVAVACGIGADLSAFAMMTPKAYRDPRSETLSTYALASLSGALAAAAVAALDFSLLLYPVYYCLVNAATTLFLCRRRGQLESSCRRPAEAVT